MRVAKLLFVVCTLLLVPPACAGCGGAAVAPADAFIAASEPLAIDITQEAVPLSAAPALSTLLMPEASGVAVAENSKAAIDYSNSSDGYVMIRMIAQTSVRLKVQITGPSGVTYTYNLTNSGAYETFPLSDGNGSYTIGVYENISGTSYATAHTATISVALKDEFAPFLLPNQYVNYSANSAAVAKAAELTAGQSSVLGKVGAVYDYVVANISYDYDKASSVTSGYLPNIDTVLATKKGICFDYAALMTAMLRSQSVPTKLVVGYSGSIYHAWISTYTPETGWVDGVIYFDGAQWQRMDPTFAASERQSTEIMAYIADNANYSAKYLY